MFKPLFILFVFSLTTSCLENKMTSLKGDDSVKKNDLQQNKIQPPSSSRKLYFLKSEYPVEFNSNKCQFKYNGRHLKNYKIAVTAKTLNSLIEIQFVKYNSSFQVEKVVKPKECKFSSFTLSKQEFYQLFSLTEPDFSIDAPHISENNNIENVNLVSTKNESVNNSVETGTGTENYTSDVEEEREKETSLTHYTSFPNHNESNQPSPAVSKGQVNDNKNQIVVNTKLDTHSAQPTENNTDKIPNVQHDDNHKNSITKPNIADNHLAVQLSPQNTNIEIKENAVISEPNLTIKDSSNKGNGNATNSEASTTEDINDNKSPTINNGSSSGEIADQIKNDKQSTKKTLMGINLAAAQAESDEVFNAIPFANIFKVSRPLKEDTYNQKTNTFEITKASFDKDTLAPTINPKQSLKTSLYASATKLNFIFNEIYTLFYKSSLPINVNLSSNHLEIKACDSFTTNFSKKIKYEAICFQFVPEKYINNSQKNKLEIIFNNLNSKKTLLEDVRLFLPGGTCDNDVFKRVKINEISTCRKFSRLYETDFANPNKTVFNPDYLNYLKHFKIIRTMNLTFSSIRNSRKCVQLVSKKRVLLDKKYQGKTHTNDYKSELQKLYYHLDETTLNCYITEVFNTRNLENRAKLKHLSYGNSNKLPYHLWKGIPYEVIVELANTLEAHPWVNIPFNADDEWIKSMANYFAKNLKIGLVPRIEYSNEVWNPSFWGSTFVKQIGRLKFHNKGYIQKAFPQISEMKNLIKNLDSSKEPDPQNQLILTAQTYAERASEVIQIWKKAFENRSTSANENAVLGVLGGFQYNKSWSEEILKHLRAKKMESSIDAIAIGTYFWAYWGHDKNICDGGTGVRDLLDIYDNQNERLNALFKLIDDNIDASKKSLFSKNNCQPNQTDKFYDEANLRSLYYVLNHQIPQHLDLLSQYNKEWNRHEDLKIKLFSYEGGQHLQLENNLNFLKPSNNKNQELEQIKELYYNANNHQKMNDLYKKLYSYWVKVGGGDFMNFISAQTYSKWAMMGLSQSLDVYTVRAPKYEATIEFARGND